LISFQVMGMALERMEDVFCYALLYNIFKVSHRQSRIKATRGSPRNEVRALSPFDKFSKTQMVLKCHI